MATTLRKLASQVIEILSGGDQNRDSQIDERMIFEQIRQLAAEAIMLKTLELRESGDRSVPQSYVASYQINQVQTDPATKETYFDLPDVPLALPYNKGIQRVFPYGRPQDRLIKLISATSSKFLKSGNLEKQKGYWLRGNSVRMSYKDKDSFPKGLVVDLVVPFPSTQDKDAQLPILPEHEGQIIRQVLQIYGVQSPKDDINDNNSEIRDAGNPK
jgi:hypothetical protein